MIDLAEDVRRQYIAQSSNNDKILGKETHIDQSKAARTNGVHQQPKPSHESVGESSSSKIHSGQVPDGCDKELNEIEEQLNGAWDDGGMWEFTMTRVQTDRSIGPHVDSDPFDDGNSTRSDCSRLQSNVISNDENEHLVFSAPEKDKLPEPPLNDADPGMSRACADVMLGIIEERPGIDNAAASVLDGSEKNGNTIEMEVCPGGGANDMESGPSNPGCSVVRDKEWVMLMATALKERGKERVWGEIADGWVGLQHIWDRNEVRSCFDKPDCVPDGFTLGSRPTAKAASILDCGRILSRNGWESLGKSLRHRRSKTSGSMAPIGDDGIHRCCPKQE